LKHYLNNFATAAVPNLASGLGLRTTEFYHNTFHFAMDDISDYITSRKPKDPPNDPKEKFGEDLED